MTALVDFGDYRDTRGRTPVDPDIFKQPGTMIVGFSGQSMLGNYSALDYYHPTREVYDLNLWDGNIYRDDGWQIFNSTSMPGRLSVLPYWGDNLIAYGHCARVLRPAIVVGGTGAYDWCPVGGCFHRAQVLMERLAAFGLAPNFWVHMLGQRDLELNNSTANFSALTQWFILGMRGLGMHAPLMIGHGCYWEHYANANPAGVAAIRAGQLHAAQNGVGSCSLGADDDEWIGPANREDGVHPKNNMRYWQFQRWRPVFPVFS